MTRHQRRTAIVGAWGGAALLALVAGALPAAAAPLAPADSAGAGGLVMVLDSSGSMADDDGAGRTRRESAHGAVGAVADALPDGYPTGACGSTVRTGRAVAPTPASYGRWSRSTGPPSSGPWTGSGPRATPPSGCPSVGFAATAVPQPGAAVDRFDVLRTRIVAAGGPNAGGPDCERDDERFRQAEGAVPLTSAVARIPSEEGNRRCDEARRYLLTVERESKKGSDAARWPLEMVYGTEASTARTRRTTGALRWPGRARCRSRGPTGTRAAPPSARCTPEVTSTSR
ncbi:hypothetical protein [Streptomyces globisporus]|uniref:hypothetical protein n=1 Tax=Streptomyces globisporus TaxID=1908 RepID=UPI003460B675